MSDRRGSLRGIVTTTVAVIATLSACTTGTPGASLATSSSSSSSSAPSTGPSSATPATAMPSTSPTAATTSPSPVGTTGIVVGKDGWSTYTNTEVGFSIRFPTWVFSPTGTCVNGKSAPGIVPATVLDYGSNNLDGGDSFWLAQKYEFGPGCYRVLTFGSEFDNVIGPRRANARKAGMLVAVTSEATQTDVQRLVRQEWGCGRRMTVSFSPSKSGAWTNVTFTCPPNPSFASWAGEMRWYPDQGLFVELYNPASGSNIMTFGMENTARKHVEHKIANSFSTPPAVTAGGPTVTPATPAPQKKVVVDPRQLATGPAPGIAYYQGPQSSCGVPGASTQPVTGYLRPPRGSGRPIPVHLASTDSVGTFTRLGGGYLVLVNRCSQGLDIRRYATDGTMTDLSRGLPVTTPVWTGGFARSADGYVAASLMPGQITLFNGKGKKVRTWTLQPTSTMATPHYIFPDHSVLVEGTTAHNGFKTWLLLPDGTVAKPTLAQLGAEVNPVSGDVATSALCAGWVDNASVVDPRTQQTLWTDCGYSAGPLWYFGTFNPDGTALAARANNEQLHNRAILGLLDARTGALRLQFRAKGPLSSGNGISRMAWEDSTHLLVLQQLGGHFALLRYGLDGSVEKVHTPAAVNYRLLLTSESGPQR